MKLYTKWVNEGGMDYEVRFLKLVKDLKENDGCVLMRIDKIDNKIWKCVNVDDIENWEYEDIEDKSLKNMKKKVEDIMFN